MSSKRPASPSDRSSSKKPALSSSTHPTSLSWSTRMIGVDSKCFHGVNGPVSSTRKVLALDLDQTIIKPLSSKFYRSAEDWTWWDPSVPERLRRAIAEGFTVVIFTNQDSTNQQAQFRQRIELVVKQLGIPVHVFGAFTLLPYKKPSPAMWNLCITALNMSPGDASSSPIDIAESIYVGDAAGRPGDHNDTDAKFALNLSLAFFTPEAFFLEQPMFQLPNITGWHAELHQPNIAFPRLSFVSPPSDDVYLVLGPPASGKTFFIEQHLLRPFIGFSPSPFVSSLQSTSALLSTLRSRHKHQSIIIESSAFPSASARRDLINRLLAISPGSKIHLFNLNASSDLCLHNVVYRALHAATASASMDKEIKAYAAAYSAPSANEGFTTVTAVPFDFEGSSAGETEWKMWLVSPPSKWNRGR